MRNDKVTDLLDSLVTRYDKTLRPNMGGKPAVIRINMQVWTNIKVDNTQNHFIINIVNL